MKESRYNVFQETSDHRWLAYNMISDAIALITPEQYQIIQKILQNPESVQTEEEKVLKDGLIKGNFLIEDIVDELKIIRTQFYKNKYKDKSYHLTLFTTYRCNFACTYCYQQQLAESHQYKVDGDLQDDLADAVIGWLRKAVYNVHNLHIDWYGGEPLLRTDLIMRMGLELKEICEENSCHFDAGLVTNGYLLTAEVADKLRRAGVNGALITLDGPPDIHNQHRPLKAGGGTFDVIIKNIQESLPYLDRINLRINVDKNNLGYAEEFLDFLEEKNLNHKKITLMAAAMEAYNEKLAACKVDPTEFTEEIKKLTQSAKKRGFNVARPGFRIPSCFAQEKNTYSIVPDGSIYKCPSLAGKKELRDGYIDMEKEDIEFTYNAVEWMDWNPFDRETCRECEYLPICMGGCPYNDVSRKLFSEEPAPQRLIFKGCQDRMATRLDTYLKYIFAEQMEKMNKGCC